MSAGAHSFNLYHNGLPHKPLQNAKFPRARHRCLQVSARNRILFAPDELQKDHQLILSLQDVRSSHLLQVLKVQPQDQVKVGVVNGALGLATVIHTHPDVTLECLDWQWPFPWNTQLYLVLAMPRPKVLKRLWATLACLGVTRVYITGAEKVEKVYFASHALKPEIFYQELLRGAEQAGDPRLPAVYFSKSLRATLAAVQSSLTKIIPPEASEGSHQTPASSSASLSSTTHAASPRQSPVSTQSSASSQASESSPLTDAPTSVSSHRSTSSQASVSQQASVASLTTAASQELMSPLTHAAPSDPASAPSQMLASSSMSLPTYASIRPQSSAPLQASQSFPATPPASMSCVKPAVLQIPVSSAPPHKASTHGVPAQPASVSAQMPSSLSSDPSPEPRQASSHRSASAISAQAAGPSRGPAASDSSQRSAFATPPTQAAKPSLVQCLFPEGATGPDAVTECSASSTLASSAVEHQRDVKGSGGYLSSTAYAVKLLAHTVGGTSVHQAVLAQLAELCKATTTTDSSVLVGLSGPGGPQVELGCEQQEGSLEGEGMGDKTLKLSDERRRLSDERVVLASKRDKLVDGRRFVVLAVGPEGGWVDSEISLLSDQYGFQTVTTASSRILDTTTAVTSLVSLALDAMSTTQPSNEAA